MATVYSNLKFLQFTEHLDAIREGRLKAPVHVRLKPTNRCNHDCWYCCYRSESLILGEDMVEADAVPEDKIFEIADDLVDMGVRAVTFSGGGEPLIYRPLPQVIERLATGRVRVAALTNGVNLQNHMAEAFAEYATWVRISIDGWDDESYMAARRAKDGEFSGVLRNIREFTARGSRCSLGISYIITRDNHRHLVDLCRTMKDAGANHVKLYGVIVGNDAAANNRYHADINRDVRAAIDEARKLSEEGFSIIDHYHEMDERFEKSYESCPFLQFQTVIGADCTVYSCHDKAYTEAGILGSIRERSFKEFWFSEENLRRHREIDPSRDCRHHCTAHRSNLAILEYLSLDADHGVFV